MVFKYNIQGKLLFNYSYSSAIHRMYLVSNFNHFDDFIKGIWKVGLVIGLNFYYFQ